ncbi:hypothetical protein H8S90_12505 [Olivibacter sp. SDN3]|uniref:hypothetical protein n=1 Tax=Olivibacter sp. SDN3 TaxID=2764720 RepID=UPI0016510431|nr:hypothetical protein [Olivibacter sp. SDN3]QNL52312.1 hypothetical protein H8S90_12505 [Olivibacter sp. SDN3]
MKFQTFAQFIFGPILLGMFLVINIPQTNAQTFESLPVLHGDTVVFPIKLVNAYPFISGTVNGVTGKFMFDTGSSNSIALNDNVLSFPEKKVTGSGVVGSGQTYKASTIDTVKKITFNNGLVYKNLEKIHSANYNFVENITPDFIGYIGYKFFEGYTFKLDYIHKKVTFYKNTPQRELNKDFLTNEKVLSIIDFDTRRLPNHPLIKFKIGNTEILGAFDTGQNGLLQVSDNTQKVLSSERLITQSGVDGAGDTILTVKNVLIGEQLKIDLKGIEQEEAENIKVIRKELEIPEPDLMTFGYRFLSLYKTVWDFDAKKIYILEY